jgi:hypothetical protein
MLENIEYWVRTAGILAGLGTFLLIMVRLQKGRMHPVGRTIGNT